MTTLVMSQALIKVIGAGAFNLHYTTTVSDFPTSTGMRALPLERFDTQPIGNVKVGDWIYLRNFKTYTTVFKSIHRQGGYSGENLVYVGHNYYWGWPGAPGPDANVGELGTLEQWSHWLVQFYNNGLPDNLKKTDTDFENHVENAGFTGEIARFNLPQINSNLFMDRTGL